MADIEQQRAALERMIDLALFLAAHPGQPIPGTVIKSQLYDALQERPQDLGAFRRMLARDRVDLEAAGLVITADPEGNYTFAPEANFAPALDLRPAERAAAALAAAALIDDPLFPLPVALRVALIKLSRVLDDNGALLDGELAARSNRSGGAELPEVARWTGMILHAQLERRRLELDYRDEAGNKSLRTVAPFGLFLLNSQWYLVGEDSLRGAVRVFALARIRDLRLTEEAFALPDDFSVERWRQLPFRLSDAPRDREACLIIPAARQREVAEITLGKGALTPRDDGSLLWKIPYPSAQQERLVRYALEQGLSFTADSPEELTALRRALAEVERVHA